MKKLVLVALLLTLYAATIHEQPARAVLGTEFTIDAKTGRSHRIPDANWHASTGQFLVVWSELPDPDGNEEIRGQLVNLDSSLSGGDYLISSGGGEQKDFPQVAHIGNTNNTTQQMSLVVFSDTRDGDWDIWGQLINSAGNAVSGANFKISAGGADLFPELAYGQIDPNNGRFLVAWEREVGAGDSEVFAQVIRGATNVGGSPGDLIGGNVGVSTAAAGLASAPSVAFDPINDQFLVVWRDDPNTADGEADIFGQLLNTNGTAVGGNFQISSQAGLEYAPSVVYHPEQQEYLVAWNRTPVGDDESDVHAQRVSPAGSLLGGVIDIAATADQEEFGDFAVDVDTGSYVIPLTTGPNVLDRIRVQIQKVSATGLLLGGRTTVATDESANKGPATAVYGSTLIGPGAGVSAVSEVLVSWRDKRSGSHDALGRMVEVLNDSDGDGLLDVWESSGYVDMNDNGALDAGDLDFTTLPAANQPNVNRKDVYVEVDWMQVDADNDGVVVGDPDSPGDHVHAPIAVAGSLPTGTALDTVITSYGNAPVANPDGSTGISLHLDVGQMGGGGAIAETVGVDFSSGFEAVKTANFAASRARVFRYGLLKHNDGVFGGRGEIWGNDFWVDGTQNTQVTQSVTFMHEFGHAMGLRHGGGDAVNCKPNYLSIMNYTFSGTGLPPTFRADYSSQNLPVLNENLLNEGTPLGDANDHTGDAIEQTIFSAGGVAIGPNAATAGNVGIDWDNDGTAGEINDGVLPEPVGNTDVSSPPGFGCGTAAASQTLNGFDDWANLRYNWKGSPHVDDNIHVFHDEDDLPEAVKDSIEAHYGDPALTMSKTGTTSGIPGDAVSYDIDIDNAGPGPARNVQVVDAWPDGLTFTSSSIAPASNVLNGDGSRTISWTIDTLTSGTSETITLNGSIDFPPAADEVTQSVTVNHQNVLGEPKGELADSVTTDIQFPEMEVAKTATASVNAGEMITYTVTYENVGDAAAEAVTVTDTLPEDTYYSLALDQGAGPAPNSVTSNADGTTTLTWSLGTVAAASGPLTIEYAARPGLLFLAGDSLTNDLSLDFTDANGNDYPAVTAVAGTSITAVAPTRNPRSLGFWRSHPQFWTAEIRARIQATDDRFDGADGSAPDGTLADVEVQAVLVPGGNMDKILEEQLLATYLNLAARRINAGTSIDSKAVNRLGLENVRDAALFARETLLLPVVSANRSRYTDATSILDNINNNRIEVY